MRLTYRAALRLLAEPDVTGRKRERNGEAGVELIEFGLVFPLLLLLVLGIVDYGFMFQRFEALTNATREGARVASLPGYAQVDIEDRVADFLAAGGVPTTAGNPVVAVTAATIPNGAGTWAATTVTLTYTQLYFRRQRGGPRISDRLLRWDPDQREGVWNVPKETELPG